MFQASQYIQIKSMFNIGYRFRNELFWSRYNHNIIY